MLGLLIIGVAYVLFLTHGVKIGTATYSNSKTIPQRMDTAETDIATLQTTSRTHDNNIVAMQTILGTDEYTNDLSLVERVAINEANINDLLSRAWVYGAYVAANT